MDRRTLQSAGTALLSILAIALAAATLSSPVRQRSGGGGDTGLSGSGVPGLGTGTSPGSFGESILLLLLAAVLIAALLYGGYSAIVDRRQWLQVAVAFAIGFVLLLLALYVLGRTQAVVPRLPSISVSPLGNGGAGGSGGGSGSPAPPSLPLLALLVVIGFVAITALALRRRRGLTRGTTAETSDGDEREAAAMGRAAGEAADRIEAGGDVNNEVYRAWREMTELLSLPSSRTRTPGEFAEAAVDAGVRSEDARELTRLFEDVRYGDADPTPDMERRAREVLREIEATYAEGADEANRRAGTEGNT